MTKEKTNRKNLTTAILSLSLLTVMAGAAVAPALNAVQDYFKDESQTLVQMVISVPALFIVLMSFVFPKLCRRFRSRNLLMVGLLLYVVGGSIAGIFSNIYLVLLFRSLVGIGVGIIMPMSTGLLSFYYTKDKQDRLMGYSSAMNQMGGVIATLAAGMLASVSWRLSFLVYLMGLVSVALCMRYLPNEHISIGTGTEEKIQKQDKKEKPVFFTYYKFAIVMFIFMFTFFIYPAEFAMITSEDGIISQNFIAMIMAGMDLVAFAGGLSFVRIRNLMGAYTGLAAPLMFAVGYGILWMTAEWPGVIAGSALVGFANGLGIPFIISTASKKAGRSAAATVMPMLSMALYLAQFTAPIILSAISSAAGALYTSHLPYLVAGISALILASCSLSLKKEAEHSAE